MESTIRKFAIDQVTKIVQDELNVTINIENDGTELEILFLIYFTRALTDKYVEGIRRILNRGGKSVSKFTAALHTSDPTAITCALIVESLPALDGAEGDRAIYYYKDYISAPLPFEADLPKIRRVYKKCDKIIRTNNSLVRLTPIILNGKKKKK